MDFFFHSLFGCVVLCFIISRLFLGLYIDVFFVITCLGAVLKCMEVLSHLLFLLLRNFDFFLE